MKTPSVPTRSLLTRFILPRFDRRFFFRLIFVVVGTVIFFRYFCRPVYLQGDSMAPTYRSGTVNFCWRPAYWFSKPDRGDVVVIRYAGTSVMLLKRLVALTGETVEFRNGRLLVDGREVEEPYVHYPCDWNLGPKKVEAGHVYVVGDNRAMPSDKHQFGQVEMVRIMGRPLL